MSGLDLTLLWLWCRPAVTAQIQPLAWDPPYATGVAQEMAKKKKKKDKKIKCLSAHLHAIHTYVFYSVASELLKVRSISDLLSLFPMLKTMPDI